MKKIQLYIENDRVELFDDESIVLTQTVQNVKDVGKVFTPFSRQFTVPASKNNNRIFKHFYNSSITNTLDPRVKHEARIDLNYARFEKGKIKLDGVQMKDNKPYAYKVTFFGNTVTLKDKIRNDKLDALEWLRNFNFLYNYTNIVSSLQDGTDQTVDGTTYTDAFIVPLITHEDRITYDSSGPSEGNLYYQQNSAGGVDFQELKPAIRLDLIIRAIEEQYEIEFSDHFFDADNPTYYNLYVWLHRKKGKINQSATGNDIYRENVEFNATNWGGFTVNNSGYTFYNIQSGPVWGGSNSVSNYNNASTPPTSPIYYDIRHKIRPYTSDEYTISVKNRGQEVHRAENVTGDQEFTVRYTSNASVQIIIETETAMTFHPTEIFVTAVDYYGPVKYKTFTSTTTQVAPNFNFDSTVQIPEIKILDFLSGLFKMFNLVAFLDYDGKIIVRTLDSWYEASDTTHNITEYIDRTQSTIDVALPYREILFEYAGKQSFFAANHKALFNYEHGSEHYRGDDEQLLSGADYKITLPFEHHKYERLYDQNTGNRTNIQWGWSVDDNKQSILGKPLLFYPIRQEGDVAIKTPGGQVRATAYHIPSNSPGLDEATSTDCINFRAEVNEWTGQIFDNTLFKRFYQKYIKETFDPSRRLTKFKARLPMAFLLNYELNDPVIVFNRAYRINSIQTNLATGLSNLELINIPENELTILDEQAIYVNIASEEGSIDSNRYTIDATEVTYDDRP